MTDELDRLERRAQEVRGQLALDLDELLVRLQPRRMVRSVGVYAREREAGGDLGRDAVRDMRHNPVPYLLIGIGIAGLAWAISSISRGRTRARLLEFSEADFVPPPSPHIAATSTSTVRESATSPPAVPAASASVDSLQEISPVTSGER